MASAKRKYLLLGLKPLNSLSFFPDLKVGAMKIFIFIFLLFCSYKPLHAQRLDRLAMSKFAAGGEKGIAYPLQKSFFGKLPSDSIHSYTRHDTTFYLIYLWLPKPVKELGLQLTSPIPQFASAWKGDYEAPDYHDSLKINRKYFDPILLTLYINCKSPNEFFKSDSTSIQLFGRNNNSSDTPAQSYVEKNNSLLRIGVSEKDTAYAPAGLYIIRFKSADNKKPEGTFVLQVGVTEVVPGLKLFRRQDELSEGY